MVGRSPWRRFEGTSEQVGGTVVRVAVEVQGVVFRMYAVMIIRTDVYSSGLCWI